ncbi:hypothetical protein jhhlp_001970 [Lomentospora prolificans]|uniref:Uncharacterized protein n=1 Tax=Lomentospora prolificans TaxID=41688 RepID=A0A2N3NCQ4_9PEZI|nr:hypothetical protein jhhlp_001970 [Lomentospora prolificans]
MDDYLFDQFVSQCKFYLEDTHYLEILNYSVTTYNTCEQHPLSSDEFDNFIYRRGAFEAPSLRQGIQCTSGLRLILQLNARQPETFSPYVITLTHKEYRSMVRGMRLPYRAIEGTGVVGPFFWSSYDQNDDDPNLQLIFRKSDVRKKGRTRGWETMLSYNFRTGMTTGYVKGTPNTDITTAINHIKACAGQVSHPLLLPMVMLSFELAPENEIRQRQARDWLRRLEHAISGRDEIKDEESYVKSGVLDMDGITRDMYECNGQVLWKKPQAYMETIKEFRKAMMRFRDQVSEDKFVGELDKMHRSMMARMEFYMSKLKGLENYSWTTLERLRIQREAASCMRVLRPPTSADLYNISAIRESKLSLQIAKEQKYVAHAAKHDGTAMKTLSLLGAIFLPGTYLASVFSMTFFNFGNDADPVVSTNLWIYFAITVPLTILIVGTWLYFSQRRKRKFKLAQAAVDDDVEVMEREIMATMRRKTLNKENTWNSLSPKKE